MGFCLGLGLGTGLFQQHSLSEAIPATDARRASGFRKDRGGGRREQGLRQSMVASSVGQRRERHLRNARAVRVAQLPLGGTSGRYIRNGCSRATDRGVDTGRPPSPPRPACGSRPAARTSGRASRRPPCAATPSCATSWTATPRTAADPNWVGLVLRSIDAYPNPYGVSFFGLRRRTRDIRTCVCNDVSKHAPVWLRKVCMASKAAARSMTSYCNAIMCSMCDG